MKRYWTVIGLVLLFFLCMFLLAEQFTPSVLGNPYDLLGVRGISAALIGIALLVADEPEFAGAVTSALLGRDPDVEVLRLRIGRDIHDRLVAALGSDRDPDVIESLELLYAGALVRAGMGYGSYSDIADRLEKSARLMLG